MSELYSVLLHNTELFCFLVAVVAAEVVKGRVSNFSFPAQPDQLGNFSRDNNETVSVSIPEDSLKRLTKEAGIITFAFNTVWIPRHIFLSLQRFIW